MNLNSDTLVIGSFGLVAAAAFYAITQRRSQPRPEQQPKKQKQETSLVGDGDGTKGDAPPEEYIGDPEEETETENDGDPEGGTDGSSGGSS